MTDIETKSKAAYKMLLGHDLKNAFNRFVENKGDKSEIVTSLLIDFLTGKYSLYSLIDEEDKYFSKQRAEEKIVEDDVLHVRIDNDLYNSFVKRCNDFGMSANTVGRALVLRFVNDNGASLM